MRNTEEQRGKGQAVRHRKVLMLLPKNISEQFYSLVVSCMTKDGVTKIVMNDPFIVKYVDVEKNTPGHISSRI